MPAATPYCFRGRRLVGDHRLPSALASTARLASCPDLGNWGGAEGLGREGLITSSPGADPPPGIGGDRGQHDDGQPRRSAAPAVRRTFAPRNQPMTSAVRPAAGRGSGADGPAGPGRQPGWPRRAVPPSRSGVDCGMILIPPYHPRGAWPHESALQRSHLLVGVWPVGRAWSLCWPSSPLSVFGRLCVPAMLTGLSI